jgi:lipopolysaccharide/colanic/teichoic acid biosynthesis glycosyltransferase
LKDEQVDYKIAPPESLSIIGSNSINTSGDLYIIDINAIIKKSNRRNKRMLDVTVSLILLLLYPLLIFIVKKPVGVLKNIGAVLFAMKSWVGYTYLSESETQRLPEIKSGVLNPQDAFKQKNLSEETIIRLNLLYARDYKLANDINIIIKGFSQLGRS